MTDTSYAQIPAGWYSDPRGSKQRRWWDGSAWTHALEALPEPSSGAAPGYANLPGPTVSRAPSPSAPTVARAIDAEPSEHFPTRRQLRDAAAVIETQKQFAESETGEQYSMGPAVSATQKPHASFSIEQFRKSPAISTASAATVSSAAVTAAPVSAAAQTHTFTPRSATPVAATPVAAAPVAAAPVAAAPVAAVAAPAEAKTTETRPLESKPVEAKPYDAGEFTNPVIPINPAAQAAKALAAAAAAKSDAGAFVPVMRTGAPAELQNDPQYQPFGMTPRITTGVMEPPTSVNTGSVWLLTVMPLLFLGAAFALIRFAPEFYTAFIQGGLAFVVVMASFALAIHDRQQLTVRAHRSTASPAWIFLTPLAYLVARAVHTKRQAGRGWAPAIVYLVVVLGAAAGVYFVPLPITAFFSIAI